MASQGVTTLQTCLDQLYTLLYVDRNSYRIDLSYRCPVLLGSGANTTFSLLPINDEAMFQYMFQMSQTYPGLPIFEVYIKFETVRYPLDRDINMYAQLPTDADHTYQDRPSTSARPPHQFDQYSHGQYVGGSSYGDYQSFGMGGYSYEDYEVPRETTIAEDPNIQTTPFTTQGVPSLSFDDDDGIDNENLDEDEEDIALSSNDSDNSDAEGGHRDVGLHEPSSQIFSTGDLCTITVENPYGGIFDPQQDDLHVGLEFDSKEILQSAIGGYHRRVSCEYTTIESDKKKLVLKCRHAEDSNCQWRLRAHLGKRLGAWKITRYNGQHTCHRGGSSQDHMSIHASQIADIIRDKVQEEPSYKIKLIMLDVNNTLHYTPTYKKAWYDKQKAMAQIFGDWDESFNLLPRLMAAIIHYNPGTIVKFATKTVQGLSSSATLQGVFWAFAPSIQGWKHCRPVITIDGTFLVGKYAAKLLVAIGIDGNDTLFPLAYAIVKEETTES